MVIDRMLYIATGLALLAFVFSDKLSLAALAEPTREWELKRFPADLNRRDSQRVKDERVFVH
jgi:hypothetical protein